MSNPITRAQAIKSAMDMLEKAEAGRRQAVESQQDFHVEEIDTIYQIRKIVEDNPGKLMLSEIPDAVAKLKAQRDDLVKLVKDAYYEGLVKGPLALNPDALWAWSNAKHVLDAIEGASDEHDDRTTKAL